MRIGCAPRVREPPRQQRRLRLPLAPFDLRDAAQAAPILKDQHFLNPKEEEDDPYESTQITALIANENGIFGVYSMREVFEYTQFWAVGSGKEVALGAMYALYPRLETAADVARAGVEAGQCSIGTRRCR